MFGKKSPYFGGLETELGGLIDELELEPGRKRFLRSRWLEQLVWIERKAHQARNRYYWLRLTTVVGAVLVPALVSLNTGMHGVDRTARVATWAVSLIVAVSAAVEQFFHFGERWRNYRRTAEGLKTEGWLFLQLSGPYAGTGLHGSAYPLFADRVEQLIASDVDRYLTQVAVERKQDSSADAHG